MTRRILSLALALMLCMMMALPAHAASDVEFVIDEWDVLADSELAQLNAQAQKIYEETGVAIFFVYSNQEDLEKLDPATIAGDIPDYYIMIENDLYWWSFVSGKGKCVDEEVEEVFRDAYDVPDTYVDGIAAYYEAASAYLAEAVQNYTEPSGSNAPAGIDGEILVLDDANLLTESEAEALNEKLQKISSTYNAQIVIGTIPSMEGGSIDEFIELAYDEMGLGYGAGHDGVFLLVCMDPREYRILSNGMANAAIGDFEIGLIGELIVTDLSDGYYADAFDIFADECEYYLNGYLNGFPFEVEANLLIALVVGLVAGVVTALVLKGQLKTVRQQRKADVYVKPGSMQLTTSNDFFLYRTLDRRKKESSSSGSSGSSGSSRSVGGGSF